MYDFAYHRPKTLAEATAALKGKDEARAMSGGMTLIPTLKQRLAKPTDVVDLNGIKELAGIKTDGNNVVVGGMTRHFDVSVSPDVKKVIPALAYLAGHIGDPAVRNRGTMGGSVANNDPAADYPAAVLGLNATVTTNSRSIKADDFFKGLFETALEDGELVTSISFPKADKAGYMKFPNPASRYAMVGVFVAKAASGVRVAVTGAGSSGVFRQSEMEQALSANFSPDAINSIKVSPDGMLSDLHGDAEYRAHLVGVMARRAVASAA
jgi:carbon-monoxide dehydrogenase medium subunit